MNRDEHTTNRPTPGGSAFQETGMDDHLTRVAEAVRNATLNKAWQIGNNGPLRSAVDLPAVIASVPRPEPVAWRHSHTHSLHDFEADVELADGDEWAEPLYAEPVAARPVVPTFHLRQDDDEHVTVLVNGEEVGDVNHDAHGWDGMEAALRIVRAIADQLGATVTESEEGSEEC